MNAPAPMSSLTSTLVSGCLVFLVAAHALAAEKKVSKRTHHTSLESSTSKSVRSDDSVFPTYGNSMELDISATNLSFVSANNTSSTQLAAELYYLYSDKLGIGGSFSLSSVGGTSGMSLFALAQYSLDEDYNNSFFVGGGLGLVDLTMVVGGSSAKNDKKLGILAFAGRRFPLWERLMLTPRLSLAKITDVDGIVLSVIPFNVSIVF